MNDRSQVKALVDQFLDVLLNDDASKLPLAADVEFHGSMQPEPIHGEAAVREHLQEVSPFLEEARYTKLIIEGGSAAAVTKFVGVNGVKGKGTYIFEVDNGKITSISGLFDTRPFFTGRNS